MAARLILPRSGWLLLLLLAVVSGSVRWRYTVRVNVAVITGRIRGRRRRGGEREKAFLKRDSRTGADTPPHPRIFRLALSHSLSLLLSTLPAFLPHSPVRSRACALSLSFFPSFPFLLLFCAPTNVATAAATPTLIAFLVARALTPTLANKKIQWGTESGTYMASSGGFRIYHSPD